MYEIDIKQKLEKKFKKLRKKDYTQFTLIWNKVKEIIQNPYHYKNLRKPLNHWRRVHIDNSFVLTFSINEENKTITLEKYEHHDQIYK